MPPISRYWLVYVIAALVIAAFPFGAVLISTDSELTSAERARSYLLLLGVFLAAGIRSGAIDYKLVETTLRGPIVALVGTYAGQINEMRETKPAVFANLLWLYRRFRQMPPFDRGPIP